MLTAALKLRLAQKGNSSMESHSTNRDHTIDAVRGLAIAGMILFTVAPQVCQSLPSFLAHNDFHRLLIGDFVFPLFLFTSGMSLAHLATRIKTRGFTGIFRKILLQAVTLAVFSPVTTGHFLGMDEVGMNLVLFFPCLLIANLPTFGIIAVQLSVLLGYFVFQAYGWLPDFHRVYLGGYFGAIWYLPIMLGGVLAAKYPTSRMTIALGSLLTALLLSFFIPPLKMISAPSFMALSIGVCAFLLHLVQGKRSGFLEYLGLRPLRVWVLQFLLVLGPLRLGVYQIFDIQQLDIPWFLVPVAALATLFVIVIASLLIDWFTSRDAKKNVQERAS